MAGEKLVDRIVDVQFDWYARFLPGGIALLFYFYESPGTVVYEFPNLLAYAAIAYFSGHAVQPVSEFLVRKLQKVIKTNEATYATYKRQHGRDHLSAVVNKAYAEAIGFLSCAIFLFLILLYFRNGSLVLIFGSIIFILSSVERTAARKRKIDDLGEPAA